MTFIQSWHAFLFSWLGVLYRIKYLFMSLIGLKIRGLLPSQKQHDQFTTQSVIDQLDFINVSLEKDEKEQYLYKLYRFMLIFTRHYLILKKMTKHVEVVAGWKIYEFVIRPATRCVSTKKMEYLDLRHLDYWSIMAIVLILERDGWIIKADFQHLNPKNRSDVVLHKLWIYSEIIAMEERIVQDKLTHIG